MIDTEIRGTSMQKQMTIVHIYFLLGCFTVFFLPSSTIAETSPYPLYHWTNLQVTGDIPGTPRGVAFHPTLDRVYVVAEFDDKVYEFERSAGRLLRTFSMDSASGVNTYEPKFLAIHGNRMYVTCFSRGYSAPETKKGSVFVIDIPSFTKVTELTRPTYAFDNPAGLVLSDDGLSLFVANAGEENSCDSDSFLKINTSNFSHQIKYPEEVASPWPLVTIKFDVPAAMVLSHDQTKLFISIYGCNGFYKRFIYVFDTTTLNRIAAIDCFVSGQSSPDAVLGMDITQDDNYLYVVSEYRSRLFRVDVSNLPNYSMYPTGTPYSLGTVNDTAPRDLKIIYSPVTEEEYIYVSLTGDDDSSNLYYTVKILQHGTPITQVNEITTPFHHPESMAISPDGKYLMVSHIEEEDAVTVWSVFDRADLPAMSIWGFLLLLLLISLFIVIALRRRAMA